MRDPDGSGCRGRFTHSFSRHPGNEPPKPSRWLISDHETVRLALVRAIALILFVFSVTTMAEPLQQWRFNSAQVGGGGEVLGELKAVEEGDLQCVEFAPAKQGGGGGILLATDVAEAKLPVGAMTVEAWVRIDATLEWGGIIGAVRDTGNEEAGWVLGYRRDRFLFGLATEEIGRITYLPSAAPFVLKEWYYVVASYDGVSSQLLYVDGELSAKSDVQRGAIRPPEPLFYTIGAYRDENDYHPFSGRLAEISVWDRALAADEIAARFDGQKAKFPGIEPGPQRLGEAGDWATWMGDNQRSGRVAEEIRLHPSGEAEWVYEPMRAPAPSWPETAGSDHWRKRATPEAPKSTFDWVHDVVVADGRLFFASSADDGVRCLDAKSGERQWVYFAGGPVRLVPTVSDGRVVFGCDDGAVYCLSAADGSLLWKSRPAAVPDRRLPGNGRLMSVWPVRTGVLVKGGTGYFGAGLFPDEGAWYCTVDLRDGKILDEEAVDFSPQGHIYENGGRLLAQSGRVQTGGTLGTVAGQGKRRPSAASRISQSMKQRFPHAVVETAGLIIAGGDHGVAAFAPDGKEPVWQAEVDAPVRGLAIADGRLFASTTSGRIYAFGAGADGVVHREKVQPPAADAHPVAEKLIGRLPRHRGYALVIGVGDGRLIRALAAQSELQVVGIDTDKPALARLRAEFAAAGMYGAGRGSVALQEIGSFEDELPFVDGIFNLVTVGKAGTPVAEIEVERVLRPWDGLALLADGVELQGEVPDGAGGWTHAYGDVGNSASSGDKGVGGEMRLRWFGRPGPERIVDRHLRSPPPLAGGGLLLVPGRDYLFGLDAHNGTVLWEREIPQFMRASMLRDCGNLVLVPGSKRVLAASGSKCLIMDAESGATLREISVDADEEEWGYVAFDGGLLVGSAVDKGAVRRELSYAAIWEGGYGDGKRAVCSRRLFAVQPKTGERRWTYLPKGAIPNPSLCIDSTGGQIFFLESRNPATLEPPAAPRPAGRWGYDELVTSSGADLVALDLATGRERWRQPFAAGEGDILTCYLSCSDGQLVAVDSRNLARQPEPVAAAVDANAKPAPPAKAKPVQKTLHYGVRVMAAADGSARWERMLDTGRRPNLTHGEQDLHPVIAGGRLIVEPSVFDLKSGEELFKFKRQGGGGCGTISASSNKLYFRAGHPAEFDLLSKEQAWISKATRPGCWINMIPANGLLLVPEGSSGCICGFPVQASMAFGPD